MWMNLVIIGVVALDQLAKYFIQSRMFLNESVPVLRDYFHITYIRNKGAAFGMLSELPAGFRIPLFLAVGAGFIVFVFYFYKNILKEGFLVRLSFSLIVGGAIGNLIDRIFLSGEVRDFIELGLSPSLKFAVFNIADSAITVGVCLLLVYFLSTKGAGGKNAS